MAPFIEIAGKELRRNSRLAVSHPAADAGTRREQDWAPVVLTVQR